MSQGKTSEGNSRDDMYAIMDSGVPYKSYIKTILGKVHVVAWDQFNNVSVGLLLSGDPRQKDENSIIDIWSKKEDVFFRRMNSKHLNQGVLIPYTRKQEVTKEPKFEQSSDEELIELLNSPFFFLILVLNFREFLSSE